MTFAKRVYTIAAIWGVLVLAPMYFLETKIGHDEPPTITHPEYFYGFVGAALAWQIVYFLIGRDPERLRPIMPVTLLAKGNFTLAVSVLFALGRVSVPVLVMSGTDLVWGVLFALAWRATASASAGKEG